MGPGISEHHLERKPSGGGDCLGVVGEGAPHPVSRMDRQSPSGGADTVVGAWGC